MSDSFVNYTTLLDDDTDTLAPSHRLVGFIVKIIPRREHFADGVTTSGVTVGNSSTAGFVHFLPTSTTADRYLLENNAGVLSLSRNETNNVLSVSSGGITLTPLQITASANDTTELVPILVDQTGKLYRGHSLFQTIAQLQQRIEALEGGGTVTQRLIDVESLAQRIRARYNALNLDNSKI